MLANERKDKNWIFENQTMYTRVSSKPQLELPAKQVNQKLGAPPPHYAGVNEKSDSPQFSNAYEHWLAISKWSSGCPESSDLESSNKAICSYKCRPSSMCRPGLPFCGLSLSTLFTPFSQRLLPFLYVHVQHTPMGSLHSVDPSNRFRQCAKASRIAVPTAVEYALPPNFFFLSFLH